MQALKTIVITLGAVLVVGFGLLVYGLTQNWHRTTEVAPASRAPAAGSAWGTVPLGTANERIAGVMASGDLIVVQLAGEQGSRLVVVDPRSGRVVGSFVTGTAP